MVMAYAPNIVTILYREESIWKIKTCSFEHSSNVEIARKQELEI